MDELLLLFNLRSWIELPWFALGVAGQGAFMARMMLQWVVSERRRESVVPPGFWWLSLCGAVLLFTYGAWRPDIVIALGQVPAGFIYARNLWLIRARASGAEGGA